MTSLAHRKGMTAGIVEERQRVLALIDGGLSLERLRVAIFDGESAEEFEGVVAARDGTNPSADLHPILSPSALVLEARKTWWEIVDSDGGECRLMGIVRELADEVERLLAPSPSVRDSVLEEAAQRLEYRWQMFADQNRMQMAQTVHEDIEAIRALKSSPCAGTGVEEVLREALEKIADPLAFYAQRHHPTKHPSTVQMELMAECARAALSTGVSRRGSGD